MHFGPDFSAPQGQSRNESRRKSARSGYDDARKCPATRRRVAPGIDRVGDRNCAMAQGGSYPAFASRRSRANSEPPSTRAGGRGRSGRRRGRTGTRKRVCPKAYWQSAGASRGCTPIRRAGLPCAVRHTRWRARNSSWRSASCSPTAPRTLPRVGNGDGRLSAMSSCFAPVRGDARNASGLYRGARRPRILGRDTARWGEVLGRASAYTTGRWRASAAIWRKGSVRWATDAFETGGSTTTLRVGAAPRLLSRSQCVSLASTSASIHSSISRWSCLRMLEMRFRRDSSKDSSPDSEQVSR